MPRYTETTLKEFELMAKEQKAKKEAGWKQVKPKAVELEFGVDIILVNELNELQSICVWNNLHNIQRIKNYMQKMEVEYEGDNKYRAVAVRSGSVGWSLIDWAIPNLSELIVEL